MPHLLLSMASFRRRWTERGNRGVLQLEIPARELYDEASELFITLKQESLQLEHSLVSLSKWESKWCVPFLSTKEKTTEQTIDYIRCMTITQNVRPETYMFLPDHIFSVVHNYIDLPMTAAWFTEREQTKPSVEAATAETIYYWMISLSIPMECQKWHLNRLLTLIRFCSIKNQSPKKQGRKEAISQRAALNRARRAQTNSKG